MLESTLKSHLEDNDDPAIAARAYSDGIEDPAPEQQHVTRPVLQLPELLTGHFLDSCKATVKGLSVIMFIQG